MVFRKSRGWLTGFFLFACMSSSAVAIDPNEIAQDANSQLGVPYVWGGETTSGFDCSGLVVWIMKKHGVQMPRTAAEQSKWDKCPEVPSLSQVKIGDAIYMKKNGRIHHVVIVTGFAPDGMPLITHAPQTGSVVKQVRLDAPKHGGYLREAAVIRRLSECDGSKPSEDKVESPDFLEQAYRDVTGMGRAADLAARVAELTFIYSQAKCCCNPEILKAFQASTAKLMIETYPAIDLWVSALRWVKTSNDAYKKIIKNLKVANGIWSFSDLLGSVPQTKSPEVGPNNCNLHGCEPLDWNKEEDRKKYEQVIDCMETSGNGANYGETTGSTGAYGRYQFTPKTGRDYCAKAGGNCCTTWHSDTPEGRACQDKMFELFTKDNLNDLPKNIPVNTCTVYIAHQQGAGGVAWVYGGKLPRGYTFEKMKKSVVMNVGKSYQAKARAATTEEELRAVYREFWSKKFGGDIFANVGSPASSYGDFLDNTEKFSAFAMRRIMYYRKGILLEQRKLDRFYDIGFYYSNLINSALSVDTQYQTIFPNSEGE